MKPKWTLAFAGAWFLIGCAGLYNLSLRPAVPAEIRIIVDKLHVGDRPILSIDGQPISNEIHLVDWIDTRKIGDEITLQFEDGSEQKLILKKRYSLAEVIFYGLVGIIYFLIATIIYLNHKSQEEKYLAYSAYCFGYILMVSWQGIQLPIAVSSLINLVYFFSYPQACIMLLMFSYSFPSPSIPGNRLARQKTVLQVTGIFFSLLLAFLFFRKSFWPSVVTLSTFRSIYWIFYVFILLTLIMSLVAIVRNTSRNFNPVNRRKLLWVVSGVTIGSFPFVFLWLLPLILVSKPLVSDAIVTLFSLVVPFSMAVAILRYRLFDIEIFLSRSLLYGTVIALLTGLYMSALALSSYVLYRQFSFESGYLSIISAILVALFFNPIKSRVQRIIDKRFFRIRYDRFQSLQAFSKDLETCRDEIHMLHVLDLHFQNSIPIRNRTFMVRSNDHWEKWLAEDKVDPDLIDWLDLHAPSSSPELAVSRSGLDSVESGLTYEVADFPKPWTAMVCITDNVLWFLGQKKAGIRYWKEDFDLALQMAQETSIHLDRLSFMRRAMTEATEKEKAQQESEWKSMLVAEVAHDLRAPLNTILWKLKNLESDIQGRNHDPESSIAQIKQQVNNLQAIVQNILMLSQKEHGRLAIKFDSIQIGKLVDEVLSNLQSILALKNIKVGIECPDDLTIKGDDFMFRVIVLNIVENAAKYSPDATAIKISASPILREGKEQVLIKISDQGKGIPEKILRNISQPFIRHDKETGFNLGLYIMHQFVALLQGDIKVHSTAGQGTTVELYFDRAGKGQK